MGNCQNCDCNYGANKYEYDDNKVDINKKADTMTQAMRRTPTLKERKPSQVKSNSQYQADQQRYNKPDALAKIIKIQSLYRGFKARIYSKLLQKSTKSKKKYFLDEEFKETISKTNKIQKDQQLTKKEYTYKCSNAKYSGQFLGGFRHGKGTMVWADGAKYEGEWSYGKAEGFGKFTHIKGEIYEGFWYNDKAQGKGKYLSQNAAEYDGDWHQDLQHGKGREIWPDNSEFIGTYRDGRKNGLGKYKWADGAQYEGEWEDNEIAGYGYYQWSDGRKYVGHWKSNIMDHFGHYTWQDGRMYEGFYQDDKKHGFGIYTWSDMKRYAGYWHGGKQHGIGIFISKEGKKKFGLWEDGKKLRWFNEEEVKGIESGQIILKDLFINQDESFEKIKEFTRQFQPPTSFFNARQNLQNKLTSLGIKAEMTQQQSDQGNLI